MTYLFTYEKKEKLTRKTPFLKIMLWAAVLMMYINVNAQTKLIGLTSNGGIDGKGTAFSIETNGSNFYVIKGFNDWGNNANGNLFKNDNGNFYGMTSKGGTFGYGTIFMMTPAG